jgi:hypothetical protein
MYIFLIDIDDNIIAATSYSNIKTFQEFINKSHDKDNNDNVNNIT